jgi:hypothetical protein
MHLLNKGLIRIVGRKEVPGRPYVYGTTGQFLEYFGLRSLEDLPKLEEFPALMAQENSAPPTSNADPAAAETDASAVSPTDNLPASPSAEASAGAVPPLTPEQAQKALDEELARARTRLDIEELERRVEISPSFSEPGALGESSGQARKMSGGEGIPEGNDGISKEAQ